MRCPRCDIATSEQHRRDRECVEAWQRFSADLVSAVIAAIERVELCRANDHYKRKAFSSGYCIACLAAGQAAVLVMERVMGEKVPAVLRQLEAQDGKQEHPKPEKAPGPGGDEVTKGPLPGSPPAARETGREQGQLDQEADSAGAPPSPS